MTDEEMKPGAEVWSAFAGQPMRGFVGGRQSHTAGEATWSVMWLEANGNDAGRTQERSERVFPSEKALRLHLAYLLWKKSDEFRKQAIEMDRLAGCERPAGYIGVSDADA